MNTPPDQNLILRLPKKAIDQISAGEVITRPANVVKELVENSIDAGALNIRVVIEQSGLKSIEVIDNGHGIAKHNAELLCQRYATSKLRNADDLNRISTFGFRGEALASISEMADVEVKSFNMQADKMGWHGRYKHSVLCAPPVDKYIQLPGTQIRISDLFANQKPRRNCLASSYLDEKKAITELITKLAIHHRNKITFILSEKPSNNDLVCSLAPIDTGPCIGNFYGVDMEANMMEMTLKATDGPDGNKTFNAEIHIAFSYKKSTGSLHQSSMILFVNNRLVDCEELRREVGALILEFFGSKQYASLIYISLVVPARDVDVNTHPAKATVTPHHQEEIIALILTELRSKFCDNLSSHIVPTKGSQTRTIGELMQISTNSKNSGSSQSESPINEQRLKQLAPACLTHSSPTPSFPKRPAYPYQQVHNDSTQATLLQSKIPPSRRRRDLKLLSLTTLRDQVASERASDPASIKVIKGSVFVGIFDHDRALIQHETKLYAINLKSYIKEQMYQFYLFDFGNFPPIEILPPGNKIYFFIDTHLKHLRNHHPEELDKLTFKTPETIIDELITHAEMFQDYLSMKLTRQEVMTIPNIVPEHVPNLVYLGQFLVRLANNVTYTTERDCLHQLGRVLADFYSQPPANMRDMGVHKKYHEFVEVRLYDAIKRYLMVPNWLLTKENICQITDTHDLYKVFERC